MYTFDPTRVDLVKEFHEKPFGIHSPDLQYLLNFMRSPSTLPHFVLLVENAGKAWRLALMPHGATSAPARTEHVFSSLEDAERFVFDCRWKELSNMAKCNQP